MSSRHFSALEKAARASAQNWPNRRPATAMPNSEFTRYNNGANLMLSDVRRSIPFNGNEAIRDPAPFGVRILFRTCHIAAILARQNDIAQDELAELLRTETTFRTIDTLLTNTNPVSSRVEEKIGLQPTDIAVGVNHINRWNIKKDGLSVTGLITTVKDTERAVGIENRSAICPAHKAKIIRPLFDAAITICDRDKNLFERSLRP